MSIFAKIYDTYRAHKIGRGHLLSIASNIITARALERRAYMYTTRGLARYGKFGEIGQEGGAAMIMHLLSPDDILIPHYRTYTSILGKGSSIDEVAAEILGKKSGLMKGFGSQGNFLDIKNNIFPNTQTLGQSFSTALGMAFAARERGRAGIVVHFFGDGSTARGNFYSALNLAALWSLPMVFVCVNNQLAKTMRFDSFSAVPLIKKVSAMGVRALSVDGNNVVRMYSPIERLMSKVRTDGKPAFIELRTHRMEGHMTGDELTDADEREIKRWRARDPLLLLIGTLSRAGLVNENEISAIRRRSREEVDRAFARAINEQPAEPEEYKRTLYA